jgi:sulfoquinovose isomerase
MDALASRRAWLLREPEKLFLFFERRIFNPLGGFYDLDDGGRPAAPGYGAADKPARYLFATSRIIHGYAIAYLVGRPGADTIVDHGMNFLWNNHRDSEYGGYHWGVGYDGPSASTKQAYGSKQQMIRGTYYALRIADLIVGRHVAAKRLAAT